MTRVTRTPRCYADSIPAFIHDCCGLLSVAVLVAVAALVMP
jgi:hypothetical protein